jgi:hypothetical protein
VNAWIANNIGEIVILPGSMKTICVAQKEQRTQRKRNTAPRKIDFMLFQFYGSFAQWFTQVRLPLQKPYSFTIIKHIANINSYGADQEE